MNIMRMRVFTNWFSSKSSGETLLEVIVALLVISMGAATAASLIITSIQANLFNKDALIATNLAQSGLEYMRNLRDSNWMAYSADTENCWNMKSSVGVCGNADLIPEANSAKTTNPKQGFALGSSLSEALDAKLDLSDGASSGENEYLIYYWDKDNSVDSDGDNDKTNDKDIMASESVTGATQGDATKYYRSVEVQYKKISTDANGVVTMTDSDSTEANAMIVVCRVQWLDGPTVHEIRLGSTLLSYK